MNCTWTPSNTFGSFTPNFGFGSFGGFGGYCPSTNFFGSTCGPNGCSYPCNTPCNSFNTPFNGWNNTWTPANWFNSPTNFNAGFYPGFNSSFGFGSGWNNSFPQPQPWNWNTWNSWTPAFQNGWFQNSFPFTNFSGWYSPFATGFNTGYQNSSQPCYGFQNCNQPGFFNNNFPNNGYFNQGGAPFGPYGMSTTGFHASQPCSPTPDMARHNGFGIREAA